MKFCAVLLIAFSAALVVQAAAGAGAASATVAVLCKVKAEKEGKPTSCPSEQVHPIGSKLGFEQLSSHATFKLGLGNVECSGVAIMIENTAASGEPIPAATDKFVPSGCGGACTTVTAKSLPWETTISYIAGTWNGSVAFKGSELEFSNCVGGTTCRYSVGAEIRGGDPAKLIANHTMVKIAGGFLCASPGTWEDELQTPPEYYEVEGPTGIYVLPK